MLLDMKLEGHYKHTQLQQQHKEQFCYPTQEHDVQQQQNKTSMNGRNSTCNLMEMMMKADAC